MSRWFRFYADAMRNPKVASLSDYQFRLWVQLLAVASENDGIIPNEKYLKNILRVRLDHLLRGLNGLITIGLIEPLERHNDLVTKPLERHYTPHNWSKRQYKSDTSTERVTLHRKRVVTPPETEADTDKNTLSKDSGASADSDKVFWDGAKAYLAGYSKNPGALIGKWCRDYGKPETARAIGAAQIDRAVDPIPYIERVLRGNAVKAKEYTGPC